MTTVESAQEIGSTSSVAAEVPIATIRTRLAGLWPLTMVALGLFLTVIWTAGLLGLVVVLLI
jgi:hypothetical protein